ncbi:MAG TPA: hypothetical protein VG742_11905 [Dongiaceae bacterium]|nr:hypothetical protein [Dongiaceae bacterium]
MSQRIVSQTTLSRALQRRLSMPVLDHGFDVVSDPPPAKRVPEPEQEAKGADDAPQT